MNLLPPDKAFYSVAEAAELLSVAKSTVYAEINAGRLPKYRFASRTIIAREDLERLLKPGKGPDR